MNITQTSSTSRQAIPESWIEKLFDKMLLTYGKKFTDQWGGSDPDKLIAHWSNELAGYSGDELARGYRAMENREWPPTLPEYKKMCRPPVDSTVAYYESLNGLQAREAGEIGEWSHPAIFWAATKIGAFDFKNQPYTGIKARWERALEVEMEKGEWAAIPVPLVALPSPGKSETAKENATKMIKQLDAEGVIKKASDRTDHKAWIKKVFERQKRGDETLPGVSVNFAKEAMKAREA